MSIDALLALRRELHDLDASAAVGAAGEPSSATFVTSDEETIFIHSVEKRANALRDAIPSRLSISPATYVNETSSNDPFWTEENKKRYRTVFDFFMWKTKLNEHVQQWDGRNVLDKTGRFIAGNIIGVVAPPVGLMVIFTVNDWAEKTSAFDKELTTWANRLVREGIVAPKDVPADEVDRPQSWLSGDGEDFGVKKTAENIFKPIVTVAAIGLAAVFVVKVLPALQKKGA